MDQEPEKDIIDPYIPPRIQRGIGLIGWALSLYFRDTRPIAFCFGLLGTLIVIHGFWRYRDTKKWRIFLLSVGSIAIFYSGWKCFFSPRPSLASLSEPQDVSSAEAKSVRPIQPKPSSRTASSKSGQGGRGGKFIATDNALIEHARTGNGGAGGAGGNGGAGGDFEAHGNAHILNAITGNGGDAGHLDGSRANGGESPAKAMGIPPLPDGRYPGRGGYGVNGGGGGGSGACAEAIIPVIPGHNLNIVVGDGGKEGKDGGDTMIFDPLISTTTPLFATHGGHAGHPAPVCSPTMAFDDNGAAILNDCLQKIKGKPIEFYYEPNYDHDADRAVKSFFEQHGIVIADARGKTVKSNLPFGIGMRCELVPPVVVVGPRPEPSHGPQGAFVIIPTP
jgi:hypothetical protein